MSFLVWFCVAKFFNACILAPQKRDVKEITQRADSRVQEKTIFLCQCQVDRPWLKDRRNFTSR